MAMYGLVKIKDTETGEEKQLTKIVCLLVTMKKSIF